jgi:acylphosphatase
VPALRFLVCGRVQGVWFRGATQREAGRLGLAGIARNLADGRVEVIASGEPAALRSLAGWLAEGPPLAGVDSVHEEPWHEPVEPGFHTG